MTKRKKKLRIIQISLFFISALIIIFTYSEKDISRNEIIVSTKNKEVIKDNLSKSEQPGDIFYNIEYSGFDLSGNRYILKAEEANNSKTDQDFVFMKKVNAIFYFKDQTVLEVWSDSGKYNNRTLDMYFNKNVKALYEKSELFAQNALYSNSKGVLKITDDVLVSDEKGAIKADELLFDIKKQTLDINSFSNNKINAKVNIK
tara:strand:+ start:1609 stop:2214 length:606 start_codon:yes stop_codon:yes gene_type:complete